MHCELFLLCFQVVLCWNRIIKFFRIFLEAVQTQILCFQEVLTLNWIDLTSQGNLIFFEEMNSDFIWFQDGVFEENFWWILFKTQATCLHILQKHEENNKKAEALSFVAITMKAWRNGGKDIKTFSFLHVFQKCGDWKFHPTSLSPLSLCSLRLQLRSGLS